MRTNFNLFRSWCAYVLLVLGASACVVTGDEPIDDDSPASRPVQPSDTAVTAGLHGQTIETAENMDPCTALLGCIYTANQNGNDWLVPTCYQVLGPACAATLK